MFTGGRCRLDSEFVRNRDRSTESGRGTRFFRYSQSIFLQKFRRLQNAADLRHAIVKMHRPVHLARIDSETGRAQAPGLAHILVSHEFADRRGYASDCLSHVTLRCIHYQ